MKTCDTNNSKRKPEPQLFRNTEITTPEMPNEEKQNS